ncbi:hypothetical protein GPECTOR_1g643 [Gonium pectorale]|uniref:Methanethiol oxidase n=1 Tax=Gonium pectorale TaxID=33097 RepID=A0A150H3T2_GONPE|nr:hypothetical protein GPECTOR_1g643 [Gonium pectorale]|eukprot:KXZ56714.1 hypothetical protein GPECTOR_1g643 [Gonium pectorale]
MDIEAKKDRVSMEKFGCKFSELKDPQDRMSVGGTVGGNIRKDAYHNGPREKLLYVPCVIPDHARPDYVATIDVDPESPTYKQVIHRLPMPHIGDELHHTGVDTATDPRAPRIAAVAEPKDIQAATGLSYLHTSHCAPDGSIMVSAMGDAEGTARGSFLLLNQDLTIKGVWSPEETPYGYDFWYQPRLNVMVSSGWGAPKAFSKGFNPAEVPEHYGNTLYVWDWKERVLKQKLELGPKGLLPLEVRFLHEPSSPHGFVGAALSSTVIHFTRPSEGADWVANVVVEQPWTKVEGWVLPELPPCITDILISLDDRFLYLSNWLRGDIVQYDISDPAHPRLAGRVWVGGLVRKGGPLKVIEGLPEDTPEPPEVPTVAGLELRGGPQMLQLSLDGKRLYVTNSLYSPWDKQFYPPLVEGGSHLLKIDVDTDKGGLTLDTDWIIDFGKEPGGPVLAHEIRYPGGDCSSDIWI